METANRIKHLPVALFTSIMGFGGFTLALEKAGLHSVSFVFFIVCLIILASLSFLYLIKIIKYFDEVKKEFFHPVKHAFFTAFSISLLLMSAAFLSYQQQISYWFWVVGTSIHFLLTLRIVSFWLFHDNFKIEVFTPAWFVPAVGNVMIPIAGSVHAHPFISWFFLSYGIFFWIILQSVAFYRIVFHAPIADKLLPTVFIMLVPPSLVFISYIKLTGQLNEFAIFIYSIALFIVMLLFFNIHRFLRISFSLPWWAYAFPLGAFSIASFIMGDVSQLVIFYYLALLVLVCLGCLLTWLTIKTAAGILSGNIFKD